jgi:hypothetical protein
VPHRWHRREPNFLMAKLHRTFWLSSCQDYAPFHELRGDSHHPLVGIVNTKSSILACSPALSHCGTQNTWERIFRRWQRNIYLRITKSEDGDQTLGGCWCGTTSAAHRLNDSPSKNSRSPWRSQLRGRLFARRAMTLENLLSTSPNSVTNLGHFQVS